MLRGSNDGVFQGRVTGTGLQVLGESDGPAEDLLSGFDVVVHDGENGSH